VRIPQKSLIAIPEAEINQRRIHAPNKSNLLKKQKEQIKPSDDQNYLLYQVKKQGNPLWYIKQYNVTLMIALMPTPFRRTQRRNGD